MHNKNNQNKQSQAPSSNNRPRRSREHRDQRSSRASHGNQIMKNATVFIGGVPIDFTPEDLLPYFRQFGVVKDLQLKKRKESDLYNLGFGYIEADESATAAILLQPFHDIKERRIECKPFMKKGQRKLSYVNDKMDRTVYAYGIPMDWDLSKLKYFFEDFGRTENLYFLPVYIQSDKPDANFERILGQRALVLFESSKVADHLMELSEQSKVGYGLYLRRKPKKSYRWAQKGKQEGGSPGGHSNSPIEFSRGEGAGSRQSGLDSSRNSEGSGDSSIYEKSLTGKTQNAQTQKSKKKRRKRRKKRKQSPEEYERKHKTADRNQGGFDHNNQSQGPRTYNNANTTYQQPLHTSYLPQGPVSEQKRSISSHHDQWYYSQGTRTKDANHSLPSHQKSSLHTVDEHPFHLRRGLPRTTEQTYHSDNYYHQKMSFEDQSGACFSKERDPAVVKAASRNQNYYPTARKIDPNTMGGRGRGSSGADYLDWSASKQLGTGREDQERGYVPGSEPLFTIPENNNYLNYETQREENYWQTQPNRPNRRGPHTRKWAGSVPEFREQPHHHSTFRRAATQPEREISAQGYWQAQDRPQEGRFHRREHWGELSFRREHRNSADEENFAFIDREESSVREQSSEECWFMTTKIKPTCARYSFKNSSDCHSKGNLRFNHQLDWLLSHAGRLRGGSPVHNA